MTWNLEPGDDILRKDLHKIYGGRRQGGVSPSVKSPNVMIFTDPVVGQRHGYLDGWGQDGAFHYTGEGRFGDQQMTQGNRTILDSDFHGRAIRLFHGAGGRVTYVGQLEVDPTAPWYPTDAPESGGGNVRQVIVFRLNPIGIVAQELIASLPPLVDQDMALVSIESLNTETFVINPSAEPNEGERREQKLVLRYQAHLEAKGSTVVRNRCRPQGEAKPLFSDVFDQTRNNLIEAKGSASRPAVRMAIGQLADYARFVADCSKGALFPERPREDLMSLLRSQNITAIWPTEDGGFADDDNGALT